jgi:tRNA threonylcarbamoyladenosine biosynthesis protein TsaE
MQVTTHGGEATRALGERLGRLCPPDTTIALVGDLGAGKTAFAQGVAMGLGVPGPVVSPTFLVVAVHEGGRLPLVHVDLYRVEDARELEQLGLDELVQGAVVVIEWADLHPSLLPTDHLAVEISHADDARVLSLSATGPRHGALVEALRG